ncbi:MAG: hypothetical protein E6G29_03430 [Actinobacteria bacterium]|nr:MAG: hypothetical protein E6G29_03430 [Actinomycetota bacterium]
MGGACGAGGCWGAAGGGVAAGSCGGAPSGGCPPPGGGAPSGGCSGDPPRTGGNCELAFVSCLS